MPGDTVAVGLGGKQGIVPALEELAVQQGRQTI